MRVELLDHGYLSLVETWGSDERIVEAARMSTGKGFLGWGTADAPGDEKLLKFLSDNAHATPFEMAGLIVEVQAPIMVFREWHRHRTQSYNEMSARYTPLPDVNYLPSVERSSTRRAQACGPIADFLGPGSFQTPTAGAPSRSVRLTGATSRESEPGSTSLDGSTWDRCRRRENRRTGALDSGRARMRAQRGTRRTVARCHRGSRCALPSNEGARHRSLQRGSYSSRDVRAHHEGRSSNVRAKRR